MSANISSFLLITKKILTRTYFYRLIKNKMNPPEYTSFQNFQLKKEMVSDTEEKNDSDTMSWKYKNTVHCTTMSATILFLLVIISLSKMLYICQIET